MEDAVEALKMAFSVFAFIIALSIVFAMFSQAREVSDIVLAKTDNTYFAQYELPNQSINGREVGIETILPTLYRYYKEKFSIDIITSNNDKYNEKFDEEIERLVYRRGTDWEQYKELYPNGISWLASPDIDTQRRVTAYVMGEKLNVNGTVLKKYAENKKNLRDYRNSTFIETFEQKNTGEEKYVGEDGSVIYLTQGTTKLYITYTLNK